MFAYMHVCIHFRIAHGIHLFHTEKSLHFRACGVHKKHFKWPTSWYQTEILTIVNWGLFFEVKHEQFIKIAVKKSNLI